MQDKIVTQITVVAIIFIFLKRIFFVRLQYIRNMTKLVFIKGDCSKFIVRVSQDGFINCCLSHGVSPTRIAKINGLRKTACSGDLVVIELCNSFLYEVLPNENFNSICDKFNLTSEELFLVNQTYDFYPWQMIEIPKK